MQTQKAGLAEGPVGNLRPVKLLAGVLCNQVVAMRERSLLIYATSLWKTGAA